MDWGIQTVPIIHHYKAKRMTNRTSIYSCNFCEKQHISSNSLQAHQYRCKRNPNKIIVNNLPKKNVGKPCRFCNQNIRVKDLNKHEIWCDNNPNYDKVRVFFKNDPNKILNQYTKSILLGLPQYVASEETRQKLAKHSKNIQWTDEKRKKHSDAMKLAVVNNPESYKKSNRRGKRIKKYDMDFDSPWELDFYEWCLKNNIAVIDYTGFFKYEFEGNIHNYNPDYYLPDYNLYVEVKGYHDEKDLCKWSNFTKDLTILFHNEMKMIWKDTMNIDHILSLIGNGKNI